MLDQLTDWGNNMNFFISDAMAANGAQAQGPDGSFLMLMAVIGIMFYFLLIRPQSKRIKEHKKMVESLAKGDEVVTNGGLMGRVTELGDGFLKVEIADGINVKVQRQAISALLPKGSLKAD